MHGRPRHPEPLSEKQQEVKQLKLEKYKQATQIFLAQHQKLKQQVVSQHKVAPDQQSSKPNQSALIANTNIDATTALILQQLDLTQRLITVNPDYYSLFNSCRICILARCNEFTSQLLVAVAADVAASQVTTSSSSSSSQQNAATPTDTVAETEVSQLRTQTSQSFQTLIREQLRITQAGLTKNPKSYSCWSHRLWTFDILVLSRDVLLQPQSENATTNHIATQQPFETLSSEIQCDAQLNDIELIQSLLSDTERLQLLKSELELCTELLQYDERNFHAWQHRASIVQRLQRMIQYLHNNDASTNNNTDSKQQQEACDASLLSACESLVTTEGLFAYTIEKINSNHSNYSAWHYRSHLVTLSIAPLDKNNNNNTSHTTSNDESSSTQSMSNNNAALALLRQELKLVTTALYTEPSDQSAWFYHRWCLSALALMCGGPTHRCLPLFVQLLPAPPALMKRLQLHKQQSQHAMPNAPLIQQSESNSLDHLLVILESESASLTELHEMESECALVQLQLALVLMACLSVRIAILQSQQTQPGAIPPQSVLHSALDKEKETSDSSSADSMASLLLRAQQLMRDAAKIDTHRAVMHQQQWRLMRAAIRQQVAWQSSAGSKLSAWQSD